MFITVKIPVISLLTITLTACTIQHTTSPPTTLAALSTTESQHALSTATNQFTVSLCPTVASKTDAELTPVAQESTSSTTTGSAKLSSTSTTTSADKANNSLEFWREVVVPIATALIAHS